MNDLTIKPRPPRATPDANSSDTLAAGRPSQRPKVIKLGAKERLNSYITAEQDQKLRLIAVKRRCTVSEVIGQLIDDAPAPEF